MEKPKRSKSTNRSYSSFSSSMALGSSFAKPDTNLKRNKSAISYVINHKYQQPMVFLHKPKDLNGPFTVYNIPEIREVLKNYRKNGTMRKREVNQLNENIYEELKLNEYFLRRSSSSKSSKFSTTNSFLSAVQIYLPIKGKICSTSQTIDEKQKNRSGIHLPVLK